MSHGHALHAAFGDTLGSTVATAECMHSTKRGAGDGFHDALVSIIEIITALVQWNDDQPKKWTTGEHPSTFRN
jgi:hypothetical protein